VLKKNQESGTHLRKTDIPDEIEKIVDIIRMPKIELWSLVDPTNNGFALKDFDELRKHNAVS
jgi:hypothetical protein